MANWRGIRLLTAMALGAAQAADVRGVSREGPRAREVDGGIGVGVLPTGPRNAIVPLLRAETMDGHRGTVPVLPLDRVLSLLRKDGPPQ